MSAIRTIEIDFDIHKLIESKRMSFSDTPNEVLRRELGLGTSPNGPPPATRPESGESSWMGKGVTLPHGTELRMEYNGRQYSGVIENGKWLVEGKCFNSPSAAAGGVALTRDGKSPQLDGWIYWHCKRPGDTDWTSIKQLRAQW